MKGGRPDPAGVALCARLREDLGIQVAEAWVIDVYTLLGEFTADELEKVRADLFTDPIIQDSAVNRSMASGHDSAHKSLSQTQ